MLVLLERARAQSRRLDVLPGPTERRHLQRRGLGLGRPRRLPVGAGLPGRVLGAAAPAPGRTGHAGLRVAQRRPCPGHRAADHLRRPLQRPGRARGGPRLRGHHGAQPAPRRRRPVLEGCALRPGRPRDGDDGAPRRGDPDRLLLGPRPVVGSSAAGTPEAPATAEGRRSGRTRRRATGAGSFGGVGYSFCAAGPGEAWLTYAIPGPEVEPVACGFLLRDGEYGHILAGERRVTFDAQTGWPLSIELEAVDEFDRRLSVRGDAVSRHWRGHGGDSLVQWRWDDGVEGWGEDQSYFSRAQWETNRREVAVERSRSNRRAVSSPGDRRPEGRRARRHDASGRRDEGELLDWRPRSWSSLGLCSAVVVVLAQQNQIVQVGLAADPHGLMWCTLVKVTLVQPRETAMSIPSHDLPALGIGRKASGPTLVHRVTDVVVEGDDHGGVAGDAGAPSRH